MFYQQYLTVLPEGIFTLALCFVPTFVVCYLLLGLDTRSGILNLLSIIMILVDTIGLMAVWGISYNAVSLINLVTVTCRIGHRWPLAVGLISYTQFYVDSRYLSGFLSCHSLPHPHSLSSILLPEVLLSWL